MLRFGGAVILMQQSLNKEMLTGIKYLVGSADTITNMQNIEAKEPFEDSIVEFLNSLSKKILAMPEAKQYPDVVTFAFWIRKASVLKIAERFKQESTYMHLGRGVVFHIAPSNVAVNYAYSFAVGFMTGNANVVRIPSKEFPQVDIINQAVRQTLNQYPQFENYICFVRYGREKSINDALSLIADTRVIWGGDQTIEEIRKSPLGPRASEVTFADRYSLCVIDSDIYLELENKERLADDFYNDTYLFDQNACTSPRLIVWTGNRIEEAKETFWSVLYKKVTQKYEYQSIQGVNKLTKVYLVAADHEGVRMNVHGDNRIVRVSLQELFDDLMEFRDNSGYFYEYTCEDICELKGICNDNHCQTISYCGDKKMFKPLLESGIRGVDRIVPIGQTMDFDFIWDGYNLYERFTRIVSFL